MALAHQLPVWIFSIWILYFTLPLSEERILPLRGNCKLLLQDTVIPNLLYSMRSIFQDIKPYFQGQDPLNNLLLSGQLLEDLQSPIGCDALSEMIQFYLEEVMPQAEIHHPKHKNSVMQLGETLHTLISQLQECNALFPCKHKSLGAQKIREEVSKLGQYGIIKAVAEFDIFINYMESYFGVN
nr:Ov2.5 interleukin 10-like protein [Ovine gammaherpesvirus 2]